MKARPTPQELLAHGTFLRALARGLVGEDHAADDVVQEAYLAALRRPPRTGYLGAWLNRVTHNLALKARRAEARRRRRELQASTARRSAPDPAETAARLEVQRLLAEAVLELDEPGRTTVLLRYYDGLSPREIAARLSVGVRTVESRLRRARERLRVRLDRRAGPSAWLPALLPLAHAARDGSAPAASVASLAVATTGVTIMSTKTALLIAPVLLAIGFVVGGRLAPAVGPVDEDVGALRTRVETLEEENAVLRRASEPEPTLVGRAAPVEGGALESRPTPTSGPQTFALDGYDSASEAVDGFLRYAAHQLSRGEAGHLALLETINALMDSSQRRHLERLFGDDDQAGPHLYPVLRYAVEHEDQVVDFAETVFRTMAEDPARLAEIDDDVLEIFTEPIGEVLPGAVDAERMARLRRYAQQTLDAPVDELPLGIRHCRGRLQRLLKAWTPRLAFEDARRQLESGTLRPEEACALVERLSAGEVAQLDLVAILGPYVAAGDSGAASLLHRAHPTSEQIEAVDRLLLDGPPADLDPKVWAGAVRSWLGASRRRAWEAARPLVEAGLTRGGRTAEGFAWTFLYLSERPDRAWVERVLVQTRLPDDLAAAIRMRLLR